MTRWRVTLARALRSWAQGLDEQPTVVETKRGGGWRISMRGVPLADVSPGVVRGMRP